jgi:ribosomal protein L11 methylase PrmA
MMFLSTLALSFFLLPPPKSGIHRTGSYVFDIYRHSLQAANNAVPRIMEKRNVLRNRLPLPLKSLKSDQCTDDNEHCSDDSIALNELEIECVTGTLRNRKNDPNKPAIDPEILSEYLLETGALSVIIENAETGTAIEQPIYTTPAEDWEGGYRVRGWAAQDNFWRRCSLKAYYPADFDVDQVIASVVQLFSFPAEPRFVVNSVPNRDWIEQVQQVPAPPQRTARRSLLHTISHPRHAVQGWPPIAVTSTLLLRFPWHTDADAARARPPAPPAPAPPRHELLLDGGMAFGTGEHATTRLCCAWLESAVPIAATGGGGRGVRVLDYGAGSGVLGLAALKFGAAAAAGVEVGFQAWIHRRPPACPRGGWGG